MSTPSIKPTIPVPKPPECIFCALNIKSGVMRIELDIATGFITGKVIKN